MPAARVRVLGASVRKAVGAVLEPTVTAISTLEPSASTTDTVAEPTDTLLMVKAVPLSEARATPVLLLLAAYGGVPPPTLKVAGAAPLDIVTLVGAEVNSARVPEVPTVTVIETWVVSMTRTSAVPALAPAVIASVFPPVIADVTTLLLLLLVR